MPRIYLSAAFALLAVAAWPESIYYRSNEIAMPIERIGWFRADEFEYVLEIEEADGREIRTLLRDGEVVSRLEVIARPEGGRREVRMKEGLTQSVEVYDATGRVIRRERYDESGELVEIESMTYREGRLATSTLRSPDGIVISTDSYQYDSEGLLRHVVRLYPEGGEQRSEYTFQGGALLQEWHGDDGSGILVRYGANGRESARESWDGEALVTRQTYQYRSSGVLDRSVIVDYESDTRTEITYNADGQPIREEHRSEGELVATTDLTYRDGLLAVRREDTEAGIVERRYEYGDDDEVSQEELYRDGQIVTRIRYPEPGHTVEERFRGGEPFLRVYFRDGRRVREEVLYQGRVIQERSFE